MEADAPDIFTVDVEEWFHLLEVSAAPSFAEWDRLPVRIEDNMRRLLDLFDAHDAKVTCFVLGWVARRHPALVQEIHRRGHEIASHGLAHRLVFTQSREDFAADIRAGKDALEQLIGQPVLGYRAPGFSIVNSTPWAWEELATAGFRYDSSVFPAARGHGGIEDGATHPHRIAGPWGSLVEFPISVAPVLGRRMCFFGGGYLRLFPWPLVRRMAQIVRDDGRPVIYYVHPREVDPDHPRIPMGPVRRFKSYVNLATTLEKVEAALRLRPVTTFARWLPRLEGEAPRIAS